MKKQTGKQGSLPEAELPLNLNQKTAQIKIKRFDKSLPLPVYATEGSVAMDLYARETRVLAPFERAIIPCNIAIELPKGIEAQVRPRSMLPLKTPLLVANSPGTIDTDYRGDDDEIGVIMMNLSNESYKVERGKRYAQLIFSEVIKAEWLEVDYLDNSNRRGFGSTGLTIDELQKE